MTLTTWYVWIVVLLNQLTAKIRILKRFELSLTLAKLNQLTCKYALVTKYRGCGS